MRLTLRTLLAYLDEILDPADARELGKKIEGSEFASGLVHRIRSVTRKLRLGAPRLSGKGMGLDANTVAEYLDNTLPQDRAPDFEKVCLESDVQLAEVAACHQILTLVLGGPAEVDPALRDRIRNLLAEVEGTPLPDEFPRGKPEPPDDDADSDESSSHGSRPEWMSGIEVAANEPEESTVSRGKSRVRWVPIAATLVGAFLLACAALVALGPIDHEHPLLGSFFTKPAQTAQATPEPAATAEPPAADDAPPAVVEPPPQTPEEPKLPANEPAPVAPAANAGTGMEPAAEPTEPPPTPATTLPEVPAAATPEDKGEPPATMDGAPITALNDPRLDRSKLPPDGEAPKENAPPEPLATFTSEQHVLAAWDAETESWIRLATNDPLADGQRLIALPSYRPQIAFSTGIQIVMMGPTSLELMGPDSTGVPGIRVGGGRMVVTSAGEPGKRLNLVIGPRTCQATFVDLDATLVLEVRRYLPVGTDPTSRPAQWVCEARATAGAVTWQDAGGAPAIPLTTAESLVCVDQLPAVTQTTPTLPPWLDPATEARILVSASRKLEPLLEPHRPITVSLREQAGNRLFEIRTLAVRSLGLFDEFEPYVGALNERELRSYWKDLVDSLRMQMLVSPETAAKIRETLERTKGKIGLQVDRMLWGFSPEQLTDGGAHLLVDALDSDSTDVRVLAYSNLYEITGKTNLYAPDRDPKSQRRSIQSWQRDLQQGEIVYRVAPSSLPGTTPPTTTEPTPSGTADVP